MFHIKKLNNIIKFDNFINEDIVFRIFSYLYNYDEKLYYNYCLISKIWYNTFTKLKFPIIDFSLRFY